MGMNDSPLQHLFGCRHHKTTFPLTPARRKATLSTAESIPQTYVACLDCGKELAYDWDKMRRIKSSALSRSRLALRRFASPFRLPFAS